MKNLISVVIPVYEMCGDGVFFLEKSFNTLINQTYKNIEVVISDHSVGTDIEELCVKYSNNLNIKYLKNIHNRGGSSSNLNNGLKNCDGTIIKILMQDEFLYDEQGLEKINNERKGQVAVIVKEIKKHLHDRKPSAVGYGNPNWQPSLLGLACNAIGEEYKVPVFVWGRGEGNE